MGALQHVSEELRMDLEFCHEAVRRNKLAIKHIPDIVWKEAWKSLGVAAKGQRVQVVRAPKPAIESRSSTFEISPSKEQTLTAVRLMYSQSSKPIGHPTGNGRSTLEAASVPVTCEAQSKANSAIGADIEAAAAAFQADYLQSMD